MGSTVRFYLAWLKDAGRVNALFENNMLLWRRVQKDSMDKREKIIRLCFDMRLQKKDLGIEDIFSTDALYIESWGPQYHGVAEVKHWFEEWNTPFSAASPGSPLYVSSRILPDREAVGRAFWTLRWEYAAVAPCNATAGLPSARE